MTCLPQLQTALNVQESARLDNIQCMTYTVCYLLRVCYKRMRTQRGHFHGAFHKLKSLQRQKRTETFFVETAQLLAAHRLGSTF